MFPPEGEGKEREGKKRGRGKRGGGRKRGRGEIKMYNK